jgi:type IV secretory pathway VirB2 component (pilin)
MAKKKKVKKNISVRKFNFKLPEKTKRYLFASLSFLLAIIFVFSFSGNAGSVGETLKKFFDFLIGNVIYILPIIFALFGIVLLKGGEHFEDNRNSLIISTIILIIGLSGFLSLLNPELAQDFVWNNSLDGGWIGYLISWPILKGLDYIVSYALFTIAILISLWIIKMLHQSNPSLRPQLRK